MIKPLKTSVLLLVFFMVTALVCAQNPATTPIQHVVIIVKENRSFDHMFGRFPSANGAVTGLADTRVVPLKNAPDAIPVDLGHEHSQSTIAVNRGEMDSFHLIQNCKNLTCYQQFNSTTIPNYWAYAQNYLLADNFFRDRKSVV